MKDSCRDLNKQFNDFLKSPMTAGLDYEEFSKKYKHIYFTSKRILSEKGIKTTTYTLCNNMNYAVKGYLYGKDLTRLLDKMHTEITEQELADEPLVEKVKEYVKNKDKNSLKNELNKIPKKDIANFFASFSLVDVFKDRIDFYFFLDFLYEYLRNDFNFSEGHKEELLYSIVGDKKFNFQRSRSEIWRSVKTNGLTSVMEDLNINEDLIKMFFSITIFEMMSMSQYIEFDKILSSETVDSLDISTKIILLKRILSVDNSQINESETVVKIRDEINSYIQSQSVGYASRIVTYLETATGRADESEVYQCTKILRKDLQNRIEKINFETLGKDELGALLDSVDSVFGDSDRRIGSQVRLKLSLEYLKFLNFGEALQKLNEWKEQGTIHYSQVDYVQENLMRNAEQKHKLDSIVKDYVQEAKQKESSKGNALIGLDVLFENSMNSIRPHSVDSYTLLDAMLNSKYNDTLLREIMVTYWFKECGFVSQSRDGWFSSFKIFESSEKVEEALSRKRTFEEYMDAFYKNISDVDIEAMLTKLLISSRGIMKYPDGIKIILKALEKEMGSDDPEFKKLVLLVAKSGMSSIDPVRIFRPIADVLKHRVFKRPPKRGSNSPALKRLKSFETYEPMDFFTGDAIKVKKHKKSVQYVMEAQASLSKKRVGEPVVEDLEVDEQEEGESASLRSRLIRHTGIFTQKTEEKVTDPMNYVLALAQNMGAVGVRFLQILGQYVEIPKEYEARFSDVFDSQRGQIKWTAIDTIEREMINAPQEFQDWWSAVTDISETIGGGSLMTVYKVKSGMKEYVVKVLNPNAKNFIGENIEDIEKVLKSKYGKLGKKYPLTKSLVNDLGKWLVEDIESPHKEQKEDEFELLTTKRKSKMKIPGSVFTGSKFVMIEEFVPGKNLNELQRTNKSKYDELVKVVVEDYKQQLITFHSDGKTKIHTDPHVGNIRLGDDGELYWLDRGYYIECTRDEMEVITPLLNGETNLSSARRFLNLLLQDEENKNKSRLRITGKFLYGLLGVLRSQGDISNKLNIFLKEIGIEIPIRYSLLFKNEAVIRKLQGK